MSYGNKELRTVDYAPGEDELIKRNAKKRKMSMTGGPNEGLSPVISAIMRKIMKGNVRKVIDEANEFSHLSDEDLQARINKHKAGRNKASGGVNSAAYLHHSSMVKQGEEELKYRTKKNLGLKEGTKGDRAAMAYVERKAVLTAEKEDVGSLSRQDKEAWIDAYIKQHNIPKGALSSAIYSGVMKVSPYRRKKKSVQEDKDPCWDGYRQLGMKKKNGKTVPNCVPKEEFETDSEEINEILNISQRRKRGMLMRRIKNRLAIGRDRQSRRFADKDRLDARSVRRARAIIAKHMAKGIDKSELTPNRKIEIERRLSRMGKVIQNLSRKLLPTVRKMEVQRKMHKEEPK